MPVQDTSLQAYWDIVNKLGDKQAAVWSYIQAHPGVCNLEIASGLKWAINRVTPRVFELRYAGLVEFAGKKIALSTGRPAMTWRVTGRTAPVQQKLL